MENTSTDLSTNAQVARPEVSQGSRSSSQRFFSFLHVILVILLIAGLAWVWRDIKMTQQHWNATELRIGEAFGQNSKAIKSINNEFTQLSLQQGQQQKQLSQLTAQVQQLTQFSSGDIKTWKINETIYLVQLANLQLSIYHNVPLALQLLKQADTQLNALASPSLEVFHQSILKNIASLQTLAPVDTTTVIMELNALRDQVPNLSILVAPKPNTSVLLASEHQNQKKWWQRAWDNIKASMQALVIVRHQDQTLPALMSPDQQLYLQENLQLLLIQAQWAVMNHQAALYQTSIKQARSWVAKFYVQNSASTQDFLKQLQNLEAMDIAPTLPDLNKTLALVNQE